MNNRRIFGYVEQLQPTWIEGYGVLQSPLVIAKVDTGAFSGVIHAKAIEEYDGKLQFDLLGDKNLRVVTDCYHVRNVRNTHGGKKRRYLVNLGFRIDGHDYEALVGLDDRRNMLFDALIGRAFLNKNQIIVDTQKNINLDQEWSKMGEKQ